MLKKYSILKNQNILLINSNFYSKKKEILNKEKDNIEKITKHQYIGSFIEIRLKLHFIFLLKDQKIFLFRAFF